MGYTGPPNPGPPRPDEIRIGISACLLGESVRFDGGHKRDSFILGTLARFVRFVPLCPEVDIGLGTPRESLRLVRDGGEDRLVASRSGADHTRTMREYARRMAHELERHDLCGYILKSGSPSCGVWRVRRYDANGVPTRDGRGVFASELIAQHPMLPVEEEGRLHDAVLRENFFARVFAFRRAKNLFRGAWKLRDLVAFHTAEKLFLLSHDPGGYGELGRLVARAKGKPRADVAREYLEGFMSALAKKATVPQHVNVLQHMLGYFKRTLSAEDREELRDVIEEYRAERLPLIVPITLFRHHVRARGVEYLAGQTYLEPHPKELMLRNHV